MANSKFEYVRLYERPDALLPNTWLVVRLDGRNFHRFSNLNGFLKPNDPRALGLMNIAANAVMHAMPDIVVAYGQSDEFSFIFHPSTTIFERREAKIVTTVVSIFTANYVYYWPHTFDAASELKPPLPSFDGRAVLYPTQQEVRDYLSWRQADCHVNNLYNTTFWALVNQAGMTPQVAKEKLDGTVASDKNEILFKQFGVNYNDEFDIFKKGSVLFRDVDEEAEDAEAIEAAVASESMANEGQETSKRQKEKERKRKLRAKIRVKHEDIIKDTFWTARPWILEGRAPPLLATTALRETTVDKREITEDNS